MIATLAALAVIGCLGAADARADNAAASEPPALVGRPLLEWSAAAAGGAVWLTSGALIKADLAPSECRWCEGNWFDDEVRSLRWSHKRAADVTSDVLSYGAAPVSAGALLAIAAVNSGRACELSVDLAIVAEAVVASGLAGEVLRYSTARERPSVRALPPDEKAMSDNPENNMSFVSGHAATSFALAVSSGMVASMRRRRLAPVIWAAGLTLAVSSTYLRIAADEHYATDLLGGAALGVAAGLAFPLLHRPRREGGPAVTVAPAPGGAAVLLVWR